MKILTRIAPLFLLLAASVMSFAQASFTVYQTITPTGATTFNDVFEVAGSTGGDCYGAYGETTVAMAVNNSSWFKLGTGFSDGVWIDLRRTWGLTIPQGAEVDVSYGINVTTQCLLSDAPIYYPGPLEDVFYVGVFTNGPPPATCLIPQSCPVPMPPYLNENGGWQTFFDWGVWVAQTVSNPQITGPNVVWWFNNQNPSPTTYPTSITLTSSAGAATQWAVGQADSKVSLSATSGAQITVATTGTHFSSSVGDISITASVSGSPESPPALFTMTANRPKFISRSSKIDSPCSGSGVQGWDTLITYTLRDNFNNTMAGVPVNEAFAGSTVWPPPTSQGGTTDPTGIFRDDIFVCAEPGASPMPISPQQPETTTLVDNFGQTWCAGSSVSNLWGLACQGNQVQSGTMKRYLDHGDVNVP